MDAITYQDVCLPDLVGRLLQPSLRSFDPAVALVDVLLEIAHIVVLESVALLLALRQRLIFRLEALGVDLGALAKILFRVGEEIMRARADEVRPANFGVRQ